MPWEIDFALLTFDKLTKSYHYLNSDDKIHIDIGLNLSSYFIDWGKSKLPKEFFIQKFNNLVKLLDWAVIRPTIYEGDELWGSAEIEKNLIEEHIDYYISICPDMWFHEHLLYYMVEAARKIKDKYFIITPETYKLWDWTWDELVHEKYKNVPYNEWNEVNPYVVEHGMLTNEEPFLRKTNSYKWAGWWDLYSKSMIEELIPYPDGWKGYGPWDFYGMQIADLAKSNGAELGEYILENQLIAEYQPQQCDFRSYYKDFLVLKDIPNQRVDRESEIPFYKEKWKQYAKEKGIL